MKKYLINLIMLFFIVAGTSTLLAADNGGMSQKGSGTKPDKKPAVVVNVVDLLKFMPAQVTIKVGQTVEWRNTSVLVHTVTADPKLAVSKDHVQLPTGAKSFDSGNIQPDSTFSYTFTTPGLYRYFCIPHEATSMVGEVMVKP